MLTLCSRPTELTTAQNVFLVVQPVTFRALAFGLRRALRCLAAFLLEGTEFATVFISLNIAAFTIGANTELNV